MPRRPSRSQIQQLQVDLLLGVVLLLRYHTQHTTHMGNNHNGKTNPDRVVAAAIKHCIRGNFETDGRCLKALGPSELAKECIYIRSDSCQLNISYKIGGSRKRKPDILTTYSGFNRNIIAASNRSNVHFFLDLPDFLFLHFSGTVVRIGEAYRGSASSPFSTEARTNH